MTIKTLATAGLALIAAIGGTAPAWGQNVYISRLYEQVLRNIEFADPGHVLDSFGVVRLYTGETTRIELDVPWETAIQIMGDCDEDCVALDLTVTTADGDVLARDGGDHYPIVDFVSKDFGRVVLEFTLTDCLAEYCYTAYSVFIEGGR